MFSDHLENVYDECKELLLLGDMNINMLNSDDINSASTHKLMNVINSVNLAQIITKPTRVTAKSKTLIDHIYTSNPNYIVNHSVPCYDISDHYPVCAIRRSVLRKTKNSCKVIYFRNRKNFNEDLFIYDMFNAPWSKINSLHCADKALAYWSDIFLNIVDKHMPVVRKKVKRDMQPNWINDKIRIAIQTRDFHKKKNNFTEYKSWRNKVVQLIKCAKKVLYRSYRN